MTSGASARGRATPAKPAAWTPWQWPAGTTSFALRTWLALALGFYAAFFLQLDGASSAGVCVLILAQPAQGMVLSKAIYRLAATVVGVVVATALTAIFPQDRTMLLASFTVVMALQTALGTVLRDFRSYACILAGYTVAIVSISNIDTPMDTFASAVNRVAAIVVGILSIAAVNAVLTNADSSHSLTAKLRDAVREVIALAVATLDARRQPEAATCIALAAKLMPLRSEISFAAPEKTNGRARARGARSALLGLFEMISAIQAVGAGLDHLDDRSETVEQGIALTREALRLQAPERRYAALEALARDAIAAGTLSMPEAFVLDRLLVLVETCGLVRDGQRSQRLGSQPRRDVSIAVHQDWFAVALNAARVLVSIGAVSVLGIMSGLDGTATAILFTAVFVSLGAVQTDPMVMGRAALLGMPAVALVGALYAFLVFPVIDGYPLFIVSLAPLVLALCWFIKVGLPGAGVVFGVQTVVLLAPANVQVLDPSAFVSTATMLTVSGTAIFLSFLLVLPVDRAQRRLRIALAVGAGLRRALADEERLPAPRASLHYDRLAQFKTWQGAAAPTLARHRTMMRLVDLGNLSFAVRRAWRSLDAARAAVGPDLDAQARRVLPTLSADATVALAERYLRAAEGRPEWLAVVRAAGALYGTALATGREASLLRKLGLIGRTP